MADWAYNETERQLRQLKKELAALYAQLDGEIADDVEEYINAKQEQIESKQKQLDDGEINNKQFRNAVIALVIGGLAWRKFRDGTAQKYTETNIKARGIINKYMPSMYNANSIYSALQIAVAIDSTPKFIKSKLTIGQWLEKKRKNLFAKLKEAKDLRWNKQKIKSAIMNAISKGAKKSDFKDQFQHVTDMNHGFAERSAVSDTTRAQNTGRYDRDKEAQKQGVSITKTWITMGDNRVRDSHKALDFMTVGIDELFPNGCMIPGDDSHGAPPEETENCRCVYVRNVDGEPAEDVDFDFDEDMDYYYDVEYEF